MSECGRCYSSPRYHKGCSRAMGYEGWPGVRSYRQVEVSAREDWSYSYVLVSGVVGVAMCVIGLWYTWIGWLVWVVDGKWWIDNREPAGCGGRKMVEDAARAKRKLKGTMLSTRGGKRQGVRED
jgi:hypothetical protein